MQTKEMIRKYEIAYTLFGAGVVPNGQRKGVETTEAYTAEDALTQFKVEHQHSDVRIHAIRPKAHSKGIGAPEDYQI